MFKLLRRLLRSVLPKQKYLLLRLLAKVAILPESENERMEIMLALGKRLIPHYRFKWPEMDWWDNKEFTDYLTQFNEQDGLNTDRRWMVYQLLRMVGNVSGDTAECGVFSGASSYLICLSNQADKKNNKHHYLFDSYEGLSDPKEHDGSHWSQGNLSFGMENLKSTFQKFDEISFMKGWIPSRFDEVKDKQFSFVHIDVDLYDPTHDSIEFFYPRMNDGGILICDDYMCNKCPGATKAIDEFLEDKPEKMISLSAGGGFIIKGCEINSPSLGSE